MKLFLTRIGENCTVIVNGDYSQRDLKGECGLVDAMSRLEHLPQCNIINFERSDIVRSGLVQQIVEAYELDF
jgi:phosphate starvation-inducible PhoH-like protein